MGENNLIRLTIEDGYGRKSVIESNDENSVDVNSLCGMFFAAMIGQTYNAHSILNTMKEFAEEELELLTCDLKEEEE